MYSSTGRKRPSGELPESVLGCPLAPADLAPPADLYLQSEGLDLIVEAKLYDDPVGRRPDQWAREWAAWHQSEYFDPQKPAPCLPSGGSALELTPTRMRTN